MYKAIVKIPGRLWAGTMYHYTPGGPEKRVGTLYSLGKDGKTANGHVTDVGISNGLAWSSDNKTFYYIDSLNFAIDAFDYDIDGGRLCEFSARCIVTI